MVKILQIRPPENLPNTKEEDKNIWTLSVLGETKEDVLTVKDVLDDNVQLTFLHCLGIKIYQGYPSYGKGGSIFIKDYNKGQSSIQETQNLLLRTIYKIIL